MQLSRAHRLVCHQFSRIKEVPPPANSLLCCARAGVPALTTLSRLTRLVLQGLGFGIEELAMKVTRFLLKPRLRLDCCPQVDEVTAYRGSVANRALAALGH